MTCDCKKTDKAYYNSASCLVHGGGGLRDLQLERVQERYTQFKRAHPVRAWLHERLVQHQFKTLKRVSFINRK